MESYKIRMKVEFSQLEQRLDSLVKFTESSKFSTLNEDQANLLIEQLGGMRVYYNALKKRCKNENIDI